MRAQKSDFLIIIPILVFVTTYILFYHSDMFWFVGEWKDEVLVLMVMAFFPFIIIVASYKAFRDARAAMMGYAKQHGMTYTRGDAFNSHIIEGTVDGRKIRAWIFQKATVYRDNTRKVVVKVDDKPEILFTMPLMLNISLADVEEHIRDAIEIAEGRKKIEEQEENKN